MFTVSHSSRRKADAILVSLLELDTGASVTVIPENMRSDQLDSVPLHESDVDLKSQGRRTLADFLSADKKSSLVG